MLVNSRRVSRHKWTNKSHYVQLALNPLGGESVEELLTAMLGDAVEINPLKRLVIERTGGNPFFIEEIVQALFDQGALMRDGAVKITRSLAQFAIAANGARDSGIAHRSAFAETKGPVADARGDGSRIIAWLDNTNCLTSGYPVGADAG